MGALVIGVVAGIGAAWALRESQKHHATEDGPVLLYTILLALEAERLAPHAEVLAPGALVVAVSTLAHGLTAAPGRAVYRRWDRAPCR